MSGVNYKSFTFAKKEDYLIYLRQLIMKVSKYDAEYSKYVKELGITIRELGVDKNENILVDAKVYEENNSKIQFIAGKLLNLIGDYSDDAMSYNRFRRTLVRRNIEVKELLGDLSEEVYSILNQANSSRNWAMHEPESLLNAHLENIGELWVENEVSFYRSNFNQIHIPNYKTYEGKWLLSLHDECLNNVEVHEFMLNQMISDYEKLINSKVEIKFCFNEVRDFKSEIMLPKTSFEMQQKKYAKK